MASTDWLCFYHIIFHWDIYFTGYKESIQQKDRIAFKAKKREQKQDFFAYIL